MKKWKVEVELSEHYVDTYYIEAETQKEAEAHISDTDGRIVAPFERYSRAIGGTQVHQFYTQEVERFPEQGIYSAEWWFKCAHAPSKNLDYWWLTCAMVSTCEPLFHEEMSNYGVTNELEEVGVVDKTIRTDPESCQSYFYADTEENMRAFCERLAAYLRKKRDSH